jgi:Ca2+-binding EF-hand superfamily protein
VIPKGTKSGQVVEVKVPKEEANKSIESQPSVLSDPASAAISTASAAMTSIFGSVEQEVQDEDFQPTSLPATEKRQSVGLSTGTQEDKTNKLFDLLDKSHNGVLRKDEVVGAASILHMTEHEASMLFESLDVEGNGELTRSEFQKV